MKLLLPVLLLTGTAAASGIDTAKPPAQYERIEIVYTLGADQALTERRSGEMQFFDTPALAQARRLVVPRLNANGVVQLERLVRVEPDGTESPMQVGDAATSGSFLSWELSGVKPGDRVRFAVEQPIDVHRQSGHWWYAGGVSLPLPVVGGIIILRRPPNFEGSMLVSNARRPIRSAGVDSWDLSDETASTGTWRLTANSFPDWRSFGAWVAGLCDTAAGSRLRSVGESVPIAGSDPLERALLLADRLSFRLRVQPNDQLRYSCRPVEETLGEGRGNALEAQAVLWALLTSQGIPAERLLAGPEPDVDGPVRPEGLDQAWVRVSGEGGTLWFDAAKLTRATGIIEAGGGSALRISSADTDWESVLPNGGRLRPGRVVAKLDCVIDALGLLHANLQLNASGTPGQIYRWAFGSVTAPDVAARQYAPFLQELKLRSRPVVTNLDHPEYPFEVRVPFRNENYLLPFQRKASFAFDAIPLLQSPQRLSNGRPWLGMPGLYREEISVRFPANFEISADHRVDDDRTFAAFHARATVVDGQLRITREVEIRDGMPEARLMEEALEFSRLVEKDQEKEFTVKRHGRARTEEWIDTVSGEQAQDFAGRALDDYEYEVALRLYEMAHRANPDLKYTSNNLAVCLSGLGRFAEAIDALQKQIESLPESHHAYVNLAIENVRRGEYETALANFRTQLEIDPGNKTAIGWIHEVFLRLGRWSEAEEASLKSAKTWNDPVYETKAAAMRVCGGAVEDPRATMNETLGDHPDVRQLDCAVYGLSVCGRGLDVAQQYIDTTFEALQRYKAQKSELVYDSLNQQAYVSSLLWSQARILTWRGDLEEAAAMLRDVVNLGCCPAAFDDLARLEWRLGRKELALELWGRVLPVMPGLRSNVPPEALAEIQPSATDSAGPYWFPMEDLTGIEEPFTGSDAPIYYFVVTNPDGTVESARRVERADTSADRLIPAILQLEFAQFRVRGKSIPTVHLLKCVPKQDGRVAVHHSTSLSAAMMVSAVAPEEFPVFAAH